MDQDNADQGPSDASSSSSPAATPEPIPIRISGFEPGVLDPSQRTRLLRYEDSKLSFAEFDPRTAYAAFDFRSLSLNEELYRKKRVVIETSKHITPNGMSWRFVPNAWREQDVLDEGEWPRIVDLDG
jgi:hypothetical protein